MNAWVINAPLRTLKARYLRGKSRCPPRWNVTPPRWDVNPRAARHGIACSAWLHRRPGRSSATGSCRCSGRRAPLANAMACTLVSGTRARLPMTQVAVPDLGLACHAMAARGERSASPGASAAGVPPTSRFPVSASIWPPPWPGDWSTLMPSIEPTPRGELGPLAGQTVGLSGTAPTLDCARQLLESFGAAVAPPPHGPALGVLEASTTTDQNQFGRTARGACQPDRGRPRTGPRPERSTRWPAPTPRRWSRPRCSARGAICSTCRYTTSRWPPPVRQDKTRP